MSSFDVGEVFAERYEVLTTPQEAAGVMRFEARDTRGGSGAAPVVIELLELVDAASAEAFVRDMSAAQAVSHAALVPVVAVGRLEARRAWVARPQLAGATLAQALQQGALAAGDTMRMMARMASALAAAHQAGVAHGGLHPSHIVLPDFRPPGPRKTDGARLSALAEVAYFDQLAIHHGVALGKLDLMYRAPEQLSAVPSLEFAADIYAWGIICLHALTGRHPLRVGSAPTTTVEIIARQAGLDIGVVLASTPLAPTLRRILERALDVDPDTRFRDATRLAIDLGGVGLLEDVPRRPLALDARPRAPSIQPSAIGTSHAQLGGLARLARPTTALAGASSLSSSALRANHFDELITMDGADAAGGGVDDDLLGDLDELEELVDVSDVELGPPINPTPASDLAARMSRTRTTVSGILLRPSELNLLDAEPSAARRPPRDATPAVPFDARLDRRSRRRPGERVVEIDEQLTSQDHIPTVDLDEDALGKALLDLDRLPPEDADPDATINIAALTPSFTYDENGEVDVKHLAEALEAYAQRDRAKATAAAAAAAADAAVTTDAPAVASGVSEVIEPAEEPEPAAALPSPAPAARPPAEPAPPAPAPAPLRPSEPEPFVEPIAAPRRALGVVVAIALLLLAAGGLVAYLLFVRPSGGQADAASAAPETGASPHEGPSPDETPAEGAAAGAAEPVAHVPAPCEADAAGCVAEARTLSSGPVYNRDEARAAELFEQACSAGKSAQGCAGLAALLRDGRPVPADDAARAFALVDGSCTGSGAIESCREVAAMLADGVGVARDEARAAKMFEPQCSAGDAASCLGFARLLADGRGVEAADEDRGIALMETTCDGGHGDACFELAMRRRAGEGVRRSNTHYRERLEQGCGFGHPQSCKEVADQFRRGKGGRSKDTEHAADLYLQSCNAGFAPACTRLCYMESRGEHLDEPNHALALVHCRYGCELGDGEGCSDAATILRSGNVPVDDPGEADALAAQGCALGSSQCTQ